jgi:AraC family transcriptional regulator
MRSSGVIFQGVDIEEIAMQHARNYGVAAKEHIRLQNSASIVRKLNKGSQFAVTRLTSPSSHHGMTTPIPPEKSFAISLQLIDFPKGELWLDGKSTPQDVLRRNCITFYDLQVDTQAYLESPFDVIQFYLPQFTVDTFAEDNDLHMVRTLDVPIGVSIDDPVVASLGASLLPFLEKPTECNQLYVDYVSLAFTAHIISTYARTQTVRPHGSGGLAPWQERRAKEYIEGRLDGDITLAEIARECELSVSHFSRGFKIQTGRAPHQWLVERRVQRAKILLEDKRLTLAEVG